MRREHRRPPILEFGVLLQLQAFWRVLIMDGGCDTSVRFWGVVLLLFFISSKTFKQDFEERQQL